MGSVRIRLPGGVVEREVAVSAGGRLKLGDRATVLRLGGGPGLVTNAGGQVTELGADARVGVVWSVGDVTLRSNARVEGEVRTEGGVKFVRPKRE